MHTDDYFLRNSLAWALGKAGEIAKPELLAALRDDDWRLRYAAASTIGMVDDGTILPDLLIALNDSEPLVQAEAAETLGAIGDYAAVNKLIETLNDENG